MSAFAGSSHKRMAIIWRIVVGAVPLSLTGVGAVRSIIQVFCFSNTSHSHPSTRHFPHGAWSFSEWPQVHIPNPPSLLCGLSHLRLRLLQPEAHVHPAIQGRCDGEVLLSLLVLAGAPIEPAKAEVAVGDERAHAQFVGQGQGRAIVRRRRIDLEAVGVGRAAR